MRESAPSKMWNDVRLHAFTNPDNTAEDNQRIETLMPHVSTLVKASPVSRAHEKIQDEWPTADHHLSRRHERTPLTWFTH